MAHHYPDLGVKLLMPLKVIREMVTTHPDYLTAPECPYDQETKHLLAQLAPRNPDATDSDQTFLGRHGNRSDILDSEAAELYVDLKNLNTKDGDVRDRIQVLKTRAGLLEKMIDLTERTAAIRDSYAFQEAVLQVLEEVLTDEQREDAMSRLRSILDAPTDD